MLALYHLLHLKISFERNIQSLPLSSTSFKRTATLKNKRKLLAVSKETQELTRNGQLYNTIVPGVAEEYITQVSEEIEGRVSEELSLKFSRKESRILGALFKLDEFLWNPQVRTLFGTVPVTSRNNDLENREPVGDRSKSDTHSEVEFSACQTRYSIDYNPGESSHTLLRSFEIPSNIANIKKSKHKTSTSGDGRVSLRSIGVQISRNWSRTVF